MSKQTQINDTFGPYQFLEILGIPYTKSPSHSTTATTYADLANSFKDMIAPTPALDVYEVEGGDLVINVDLPGMTDEDIRVDVNRDSITIGGSRVVNRPSTPSLKSYFLYERTHGEFSRTIQLPFAPNPENVNAAYTNGVLTINIPNETKPAGRIKIQTYV